MVRLLDRTGAKEMAHRDIATLLHEKYGVPEWWAQMVTVGYEQPAAYGPFTRKRADFPLA